MSENFAEKIIDGRAIAARLNSQVAADLQQLSFVPLLCDVVVGDDAASLSYVAIKERTAQSLGMNFRAEYMPADSTTEQVVAKIKEIQADPTLCGLIVQLPLPPALNKQQILSAINPEVDVDLINPQSIEQFYNDKSLLVPPTAGAILEILNTLQTDSNTNYEGMTFAVAGQGELVGKPITHLLKKRNYEVVTITKDTLNAEEILRQGDVVISGIGQPNLITADMIKENSIVIDAGTSESEGSITGDVDFESVGPKVKIITPTPGGVGPITVSKLLENVVKVAVNKRNP